MASNLFFILGIFLLSATGLFRSSEAQLECSSLTTSVQNNTEAIEQLDGKLTLLIDLVRNISQKLDNSSAPSCQVQDDRLICRTESAGDGWIVFQQRFDGSLHFNRSWAEYRDGFGKVRPESEFWWGLERVHQLTKTGQYELLVEVKDAKDRYRFARYSEFVLDGESSQYRLAKLGGYSGTAGDINALGASDVPTGLGFSALDRDNDKYGGGHCAYWSGGGWWYNVCGHSLNAQWKYDPKWIAWKNEVLYYTRMSIRIRS